MKRLFSSLSLLALLAACGSSGGGSDAATPSTDTTIASDVETGDATVAEDVPIPVDVKGTFTISVDITYPPGSVGAGYRPEAAVYLKEDYSDFSQRPGAMPQGALMGTEGSETLKGSLMNFQQTESYPYAWGEYSVVLAIAKTDGMLPEAGKLFIAKAIRTDAYDTLVTIAADDPAWAVY